MNRSLRNYVLELLLFFSLHLEHCIISSSYGYLRNGKKKFFFSNCLIRAALMTFKQFKNTRSCLNY